VAGGPVSRREALGSFAPGGRASIPASERIDALVVTDLASEGLDLQDASVLVHLDLPWTPARLEQRVGRIVRPGSPHPLVHIYTMEPPVHAASLLDIRHRLAAKLAAARDVLGAVMPELGLDPHVTAAGSSPLVPSPSSGRSASIRLSLPAPAAAERIERILHRWRALPHIEIGDDAAPRPDGDRSAPIGAVIAAPSGAPVAWLALVADDPPVLVAALGDDVGDDPALVAAVCTAIDTTAPSDAELRHPGQYSSLADRFSAPVAQLARWLESRHAAALAGVAEIPMVRSRRRALSAIGRVSTAPASTRVSLATTAGRALHAAGRPLSAALERDLRRLAARPATPDASLLSALSAVTPDPPGRATRSSPRLLVLIVVLPPG
jgi:hypothetical protein